MSSVAHSTYRHEALFYRDTAGFVAAVVPFIMEGVALEQQVLVAVTGENLRAVRAAVGDAADRVSFIDMADLGRNPARIIPGWLRFVAKASSGGAPIRGVGEPVWAGRSQTEIAECQLHEGLLNTAVAPDVPLWLICPYDLSALDAAVIGEARRSHPLLVESGNYLGSTDYGGAYHVQQLFTRELPEPAAASRAVGFDSIDVRVVKPWIAGVAIHAGVPTDRAAQLASAMSHLAADSVHHGGGHGTVRHWTQGFSLVCEVFDAGVVTDPLIGRSLIPPSTNRPGLWLANQICDLVQVRSNSGGTTVRVHTTLRATN